MTRAKTARLPLARSAVLVIGCMTISALAQLSSPIAGGLSVGNGAGVHSPNSPFAPIQQRAGVLPWSMLTAVKTKVQDRLVPVFPAEVQALNKQSQRIQGFMMPLEPGERHNHFLLSAVPLRML
jgi:hypothetical protein